ncbi:MAG: diguanylate cyclase [Tardiphaga sp.]|jgi:diguanylate cyclase (GGDEF)-like protein|nr:diguanylate cyclase [Tardiphaga sp.]
MLSVPTLWVVFVVNFLALALVWTYVMRCYPNFEAARFWTGAAFAAAAGALASLLRGSSENMIPLIVGGTLLILACWLAAMGIQRFYDRPVSWLGTVLGTGLTCAGLTFFVFGYDHMPTRILLYSLGQSVPIVLTLPLVLSRKGGRGSPGARLAGAIAILVLAIHVLRSVCAVLDIGGGVSMVSFNPFQAAMVLALVFLSMAWNFGFLLMAIDRLRAEVADLALVDDLTGVANRRHLLQRLSEECALSRRTGDPFALLAIDLDGFKEINDGFGHGAGDECLRLFTGAAQSRLRPGDMLARSGGDEFCIVLPATTLREGAMIARHVLETCRETFARWEGAQIPIAASVGVAQWTPIVGAYPERLIAAADQALYAAKKEGKNRFAVYEPAPPLAPELEQEATHLAKLLKAG